jgi:5-methyltetrahydropteroyltriglutamate--homocysteine methyltransferase
MSTNGSTFVPRAEHVGSLLRPQRLMDELARATSYRAEEKRATNLAMDAEGEGPDALREVEDACIREAVARQEEVGLDVVTDGEFRRVFFSMSFDTAVSGWAPNDAPPLIFENDRGDHYELPAAPIAGERFVRVDAPSVREAQFMTGVATKPFKVTFPAPSMKLSPGVFKPGVTDQHYSDPDELADHIAALLREVVDETIAAGATHVQFDYPLYSLYADPSWQERWKSRGYDPDEWLERWYRVDAAVVEGLPDEVHTALHICRGNFRGAWMARGSLEPVAERMFGLPYDSFLVEWEDVARMGDYSALRFVPKGPIVGLGIIATKTPELESDDEVVQHIEEASRYLDVSQLALTPQCGFATEAAGNPLSEEQQWDKLALVGRVAERIWRS